MVAAKLLYSRGRNRAYLVLHDEEDCAVFDKIHWFVSKLGYAGDYKGKMMHHYICRGQPGEEVDHINGNTRDNQRSNLRITTRACNQQNRKLNSNNTSGLKGVSFAPNRRGCKWCGYINAHGKQYRKYFPTKEAAGVWVANKREELHGEYARHA